MKKGLALAAISLVAMASAQPALAQDNTAPAPKEEGIKDIVVTATRQATNLQDTPIAITAVTAEALEERGVTNIGDLTSVVPNAQFRRVQGAFGPGVSAFIRGIGSGDTSLAGQPPVAFYIDDVYYPVLLGANFDLLDIDHIEVLRGPQGTLFGRNSLGGAINVVARQPRTGEASAYGEVTVGSYNRTDLRAGFNLPIGESAALLISGLSKKREGYQKQLDFTCEMNRRGTPELAGSFPFTTPLQNSTKFDKVDDCTIGHFGGEDVRAVRGSFLWEASPSIKLTLTADYLRDQSENPADSVVDVDPARANSNMKSQANYWGLTIDKRFMTGDPYTTYVTYTDRIAACTVIPGNTYYNGSVNERGQCTRGGYALPDHNNLRNWGVSGKLNWDLGGNIDLTAVVAHRDLDETHTFDTDGMPIVVEHVINHLMQKYTQAEVRLSGTSDLIDWVVGGFYFDADGDQHASLIQASSGLQRALHTTYKPTSKAVFANATVRPFGERFGIVLGGRYSDDKMVVNFSNISDVSWQTTASDIVFKVVPQSKKFSWKLGANYQPNNNLMFYASAATGYSLPGYNTRPLQFTQVEQSEASEDIAYEIGAKLDLFDRRVRLNLAAFYTDFKNRPTTISGAEALLNDNGQPQAGNQQLEPLPGGPPGSTRCSTTTLPGNTGIVCLGRSYFRNQPATIRGVEAEYTINPIDGLEINGSVGWSKFISPDIEARTVNRRQSNPFWTASAGIQYRIEADALGGSITPRLDWTFESSQIVSGLSTKYNDLMPAKSLFNARLTYENDKHGFTVAAGVVNLFNKFYYRNVFDYQGLGYPQTDAQPAPPREWSLTLKKQF
ncbi:TonB-dependent receptor [Altererythrobacter sp. CC-YST694]|uniref:TonB-dependent receptor n=1 Tax=Altererythrobacter sp. CC-YST694 TaxID=2755038 RepID=UPI001D03061F|nr:TonB-dependent receptor [Altererythrobacter sp. CC-YST694]MCB5423803.1 TonB-dependent receptor [Altererythrobacter sp. CC-YST694]